MTGLNDSLVLDFRRKGCRNNSAASGLVCTGVRRNREMPQKRKTNLNINIQALLEKVVEIARPLVLVLEGRNALGSDEEECP